MDEINGDKKDEQRDDKGRFKKGHNGGPGRGRREPSKFLSYEDIELFLQPDLKDSDPGVRHRAVRLLIAIKNKQPEPKDPPWLDPSTQFVMEFVASHIIGDFRSKRGKHFTGMEALKIAVDHFASCPDSPFRVNDKIGPWDDDE
jgi:hypothetical protein